KEAIKDTIFEHSDFVAFSKEMDRLFSDWKTRTTQKLEALEPGFNPKELIHTISEDLLAQYQNKALIDAYDIYQHIMDYWFEAMQDDMRSEEHTSELQSRFDLVCRLLLEKKK